MNVLSHTFIADDIFIALGKNLFKSYT